MRPFRLLFAVAAVAALSVFGADARPVEPVTVELNERSTVGKTVATISDVALLSGGDAETRARIGRIDLAELKAREPVASVGRKSVEYRLALAGFDASAVRVTGADRASIALARRAVTAEEVAAAARAELLRQIAVPADTVMIELAAPVVVKLPEVPTDERVVITGKPRGKAATTGRVQMDMGIAVGGETLLSLAVHLEVHPVTRSPLPGAAPAPGGIVTAGGTAPGAPAATEILVRARERVAIQVISGGLKASVLGEALQSGRLGQTISVQNVDSKKTISARVTGPGTVEVDLGGAP